MLFVIVNITLYFFIAMQHKKKLLQKETSSTNVSLIIPLIYSILIPSIFPNSFQ